MILDKFRLKVFAKFLLKILKFYVLTNVEFYSFKFIIFINSSLFFLVRNHLFKQIFRGFQCVIFIFELIQNIFILFLKLIHASISNNILKLIM